MNRPVFLLGGLILALVLLQAKGPSVDAQVESTSFESGPIYAGVELAVDLPGAEHIRNIGSYIDNKGMCVFSSIEMAALAVGLEDMRGFRDWTAKNYRGGGWPDKVDEVLSKWFKTKGIEPIPYTQYEGRSPGEVLSLCSKTGRMACSTYGYSPRYGGPISHMICVSLYGDRFASVLDNNFPGEQRYEWMSPDEFDKRAKATTGSAWIFVWLTPGQPPLPRNLSKKG